jgi:hypothetical protein
MEALMGVSIGAAEACLERKTPKPRGNGERNGAVCGL